MAAATTDIKERRKIMNEFRNPEEYKSIGISGELSASEALYGFMAWLTSRADPATFSRKHEAAIAAELVDAFCCSNHLSSPRYGWTDRLNYPE